MSPNNESCRVWSRFERKTKDSVLKLRIQEPPSSSHGKVIDFISKYFISEETFQKAAGICRNPDAIAEYRAIIEEVLKTWVVVICCKDDTEDVAEILGVSAVAVIEDESFEGIQTNENQNLITIMMECEKLVNPLMKEFAVRHDGRGITVHPDYRGLGIASEFVKIRRAMINEKYITVSCAWMTSYGSQRAAEKDNWETLLEIAPDELGQKCGVVFKDSPRTFKFMLVRNSNNTKQ